MSFVTMVKGRWEALLRLVLIGTLNLKFAIDPTRYVT